MKNKRNGDVMKGTLTGGQVQWTGLFCSGPFLRQIEAGADGVIWAAIGKDNAAIVPAFFVLC